MTEKQEVGPQPIYLARSSLIPTFSANGISKKWMRSRKNFPKVPDHGLESQVDFFPSFFLSFLEWHTWQLPCFFCFQFCRDQIFGARLRLHSFAHFGCETRAPVRLVGIFLSCMMRLRIRCSGRRCSWQATSAIAMTKVNDNAHEIVSSELTMTSLLTPNIDEATALWTMQQTFLLIQKCRGLTRQEIKGMTSNVVH